MHTHTQARTRAHASSLALHLPIRTQLRVGTSEHPCASLRMGLGGIEVSEVANGGWKLHLHVALRDKSLLPQLSIVPQAGFIR